jgi:hypothetical protein
MTLMKQILRCLALVAALLFVLPWLALVGWGIYELALPHTIIDFFAAGLMCGILLGMCVGARTSKRTIGWSAVIGGLVMMSWAPLVRGKLWQSDPFGYDTAREVAYIIQILVGAVIATSGAVGLYVLDRKGRRGEQGMSAP